MSEPKPVVWMRPEKPPRGPTPAHTREEIAAVAITIADAEGLEAASARNIARNLGAGAMTLYRYLPTKEDLWAVMIDEASVFEPQEPTGDLRADLAVIARRRRQNFLRHPWLAPLLATRPILGPNYLRGMERDLAVLGGDGLSIDDAIDVLHLIYSWVSGAVQAELTEKANVDRSGVDRHSWRMRMKPYLVSLLATGEFPYLSRMTEAAEIADADEQFETGLSIILEGIDSRYSTS
ncbi:MULTISPECIES: TetR/AcrR family transcriptional regulator [Micromonospora]|uniref:Transcriptional regulator, TetR family n=1 Tax=Micromonospora yangpuensis TaxID=683228 RepID=A0A1C6UEX1_9ACTN|nr:TetR/AcrR family transcriptional regulator [Micromonospora yangpuensis]GGM06158.1 TetR family transcriptional regulator [Micromonospora yangpuensis]SCL52532.1 transcriptional regulator, TetR family [Micromonospora yangpuensis]